MKTTRRKPYERVLREIPSRLFHWDPAAQTLTAELSDLRGHDPFQRLYDDAADAGFALRSVHTGKVVRFYLEREEQGPGPDAEVVGWRFKPLDPCDCPKVKGVLIIND